MKRFALCMIFVFLAFSAGASWAVDVGISVEWMPVRGGEESGFLPPDPEKPGQKWTDPVTGMEFMWIPGGCYDQGTPTTERGRYHDEGTVRRVCVDGFWMGKTEVTNAQYRRCRIIHDSKTFKGHSLNGDDQPVVFISWKDALAYCGWLSEKNRFKYTFTLPTEAQWEYACRAGTTTSRYWGNDERSACLYANMSDRSARAEWATWTPNECDDGYAVSAPVGSFRPNAFGLYDMLGNTWEWCLDWKGKYPEHDENNPTGPSSSELGKIVRGGSWDNSAAGIRSGNRSYATTGFERYNNGFRVVRVR